MKIIFTWKDSSYLEGIEDQIRNGEYSKEEQEHIKTAFYDHCTVGEYVDLEFDTETYEIKLHKSES